MWSPQQENVYLRQEFQRKSKDGLQEIEKLEFIRSAVDFNYIKERRSLEYYTLNLK